MFTSKDMSNYFNLVGKAIKAGEWSKVFAAVAMPLIIFGVIYLFFYWLDNRKK